MSLLKRKDAGGQEYEEAGDGQDGDAGEPTGGRPGERERPSYRFVIGIDLGTTNTALAYVDLASEEDASGPRIRTLEIPQLVAARHLARRVLFPSFLYLPGTHELPEGSTALPWDESRQYAVGEFARDQGARVPGRLVSSAKSWLCHGRVDRTAPILPWEAREDVEKVSPVEASARYLRHLREAWNSEIAEGRESHCLENQLVILTVPASFDEVARELTVAAAGQAGLNRVVLIEEPLSAFYAWLSRNERTWQEGMRPGQVVWVCDVGGGTTDFTVVAIREGQRGLRFDRLAVGDHLMLGGDNMDLALARHLEQSLAGKAGKLESGRWRELCHQCRAAKEELLGSGGGELPPEARKEIAVLGSGGKLIAGTLKGTLTRADVERLILDGFFPAVGMEEAPQGGASRTGLTELGLPYVQDPAVTRHMASFWRRFQTLLEGETGRVENLFPDYLLFNGGALKPASIRRRVREVVRDWFQGQAGQGWEPLELPSADLDLAVAVGAAYYGLVRLGRGVRVGAGSPRAFYVQVEAGDRQAGTGVRPAVCLVPRGTEEGFESELEGQGFEVLANQPAAFQLLSSATRLGDRRGDQVELREDEVTVFPPIRTVLRHGKKGTARRLPVQLAVRLTEIGTLELWCRSLESPHRWQLSFDVRQQAGPAEPQEGPTETIDMAGTEEAQERIRASFRAGVSREDDPENLGKALAAALRMKKEKWSTALVRKLADTLIEVEPARALSARHEERWLNLLGFCLRPGFGDPLDEWRIKEVWKVFLQGLRFPRHVPARTELWIFLRRVAGGLSAGQQWRVYQDVSASVLPETGRKKKSDRQVPRRLNPQEELEVWLCLAGFERLPAATRVELGRVLLERIRRKTRPQELWALSRLGARQPFYGPVDRVIPGKEASAWIEALLSADLPAREAAAHALVQLARLTGDRARDVSDKDRRRVAEWLEEVPQKERFLELLSRPDSGWQREEQDWVFGESLPTGLALTSPAAGPADEAEPAG